MNNVELLAEAILESINEDVDEAFLINYAAEFSIEKVAEKYLNILLA